MRRSTVLFVGALVVLGVLALLELSDAQAACPNNCSTNGRCLSSGQCACNAGWTGNDCSLPVTSLTTSAPVATGSVERNQWHYYQYSVADTSSALVWQVNQTGPSASTADCDFYLQFQSFPSRDSYIYRDITTHPTISYTLTAPQRGVYIAGVYGWTPCTYVIGAIQASPCLNACSGHGTCGAGGVCTCNAGYTGGDCSATVTPLVAGTSLANQHVDKYIWKYYSFTLGASTTQVTSLTFTVAQASADADADLYLRKGGVPTFWQYDARNDNLDQTFNLTIDSPTPGVYYAGVFGFTPADYSIAVSLHSSCVNTCSGPTHGACTSGACACLPGYTGASCEQATFMMVNHQVVEGFAARGQWNYYQTQVVSSQNLQVQVAQRGTGDCDIYARHDQNPTTQSYSYRDVSIAQNFTLTIRNPAATLWKIGIYGFQDCSYSLTGTLSLACPHDCSGHGQCQDNGACLCASGWSGDDCSSNLVLLAPNGTPILTTITNGVWKYYTISGVTTAVTIHLFETSTRGMLWLFADASESPTLVSYDYSSTDTNTKNHNIIIARTHPNDPTSLTIGVYGNPLIPTGIQVPYSISAFSVPL